MSHQEEKSSIYDWDHKPVKLDSGEEGLAFTKGDMTVVMTAEPYWEEKDEEPQTVSNEELDKFCVRDFFGHQGTSARSEWRDGKVIGPYYR